MIITPIPASEDLRRKESNLLSHSLSPFQPSSVSKGLHDSKRYSIDKPKAYKPSWRLCTFYQIASAIHLVIVTSSHTARFPNIDVEIYLFWITFREALSNLGVVFSGNFAVIPSAFHVCSEVCCKVALPSSPCCQKSSQMSRRTDNC